jgi:hypothetical protein
MSTPADPPIGPTAACRHDGWTDDRRRLFLAALSEGHSVERACAQVGMGRDSAYKCRRRDPAFARAWEAACLSARPTVALANAPIDGRVSIVTLRDGTVVHRHRFNNRSDFAQLARLDRQIARHPASGDVAAVVVGFGGRHGDPRCVR